MTEESLLPQGWTWETVREERQKWGISEKFFPLAAAGGAVAWGTPSKDLLEEFLTKAYNEQDHYSPEEEA